MTNLENWFDTSNKSTNSIWQFKHLYNAHFALQRLSVPDVYTKLLILGWIVKNPNTNSRKIVAKLFEYCATIPNEWRQQLNIPESNVKITEIKDDNFVVDASENHCLAFFQHWLNSKTELIVPDLSCFKTIPDKKIEKTRLSNLIEILNSTRLEQA